MLGALLCALVSCTKVDMSEDTEKEIVGVTKKFTFHVKGDFMTSFEDMTRASVRLENNNTAGMTDLWVMDYVDGVRVQQVHQTSNDDSFGTVAMALTYGHHDIKFIASKGTTPSLSSSALSWNRVKDTFSLNYEVDVVASSNGNRTPELKRCVSDLRLVIADAIPSGTTAIRVTLSKHYNTLALPSLSADGMEERTIEHTITSADYGKTDIELNTYTLAPSDAYTADVTITALAGSEVLSVIPVGEVELKQNRVTILSGEVFNRSNGFQVSVDDAWETAKEVRF